MSVLIDMGSNLGEVAERLRREYESARCDYETVDLRGLAPA